MEMNFSQMAQKPDSAPGSTGEEEAGRAGGNRAQAALDLMEMETLADKVIELLRRDLLIGRERQGRTE